MNYNMYTEYDMIAKSSRTSLHLGRSDLVDDVTKVEIVPGFLLRHYELGSLGRGQA